MTEANQGTKRSFACDGDGILLHLIAARANDHDSPLLEPTLAGICDMIGPLPDQPCLHLVLRKVAFFSLGDRFALARMVSASLDQVKGWQRSL